jgi:hypothetical protein
MIDKDDENIELGISEIQRRENLLIASLGLALPYGLGVLWPIYVFFGKYPTIPFLLIAFFFWVRLFVWVGSTLCPRCASPYGGLRWQGKCTSCDLDIGKAGKRNLTISFRRVPYVPGGVEGR